MRWLMSYLSKKECGVTCLIRLKKYKALIEICLEYLLIHLDFLCPGNLPP